MGITTLAIMIALVVSISYLSYRTGKVMATLDHELEMSTFREGLLLAMYKDLSKADKNVNINVENKEDN